MAKKFHSITEIGPEIYKLHETGLSKGNSTGFMELDNLYTFKPGCTTYGMGAPTAGKTEMFFEFLMNLAKKDGWISVIYSPETGTKAEIVAELICKYTRKQFYKGYYNSITDDEMYKATSWLSQYFYIIDPEDGDLTIKEFYKMVAEMEIFYDMKVNCTLCDPFNEIKQIFEKEDLGRQDFLLERTLGDVRKNARKTKWHNIILTHCRDQQGIMDKDTGIYWYPPPTARDYSGGQAWYRKGLGMLGFWRPPVGLQDETGRPYEKNEVHVIVQKAKPKGIGKKGTAILYLNQNTQRYYEEIGGRQTYSHGLDFEGNEFPKDLFNTETIINQDEKTEQIPF